MQSINENLEIGCRIEKILSKEIKKDYAKGQKEAGIITDNKK